MRKVMLASSIHVEARRPRQATSTTTTKGNDGDKGGSEEGKRRGGGGKGGGEEGGGGGGRTDRQTNDARRGSWKSGAMQSRHVSLARLPA